MWHHRLFISSGLIFLWLSAIGQNLVPNPNFEDFYKRTLDEGVDVLQRWYKPTAGTSDYYNNRSKRFRNTIEEITPPSGSGYAGFLANHPTNEREFVSNNLLYKLREGYIYEFSCFARISKKQGQGAASKLHVHFSEKPLMNTSETVALRQRAQIEVEARIDTSWKKISGTFVANGTEKYFTLGNFDPNLPAHGSYYYIDNVVVIQVGKHEPKVATHRGVQLKVEEKKNHSARSVGNPRAHLL